MTKRTEKTGETQGANTEGTALARLLAPLVDGMTTTRHQLLTWVQSAGPVALDRPPSRAYAGKTTASSINKQTKQPWQRRPPLFDATHRRWCVAPARGGPGHQPS